MDDERVVTLCGGCEHDEGERGTTIFRLVGKRAVVCEVCGYHANLRLVRLTEKASGKVRTGAGEGATGQDTGTAWVTRSTDCPEAPTQAHLPAFSPGGES